MMASRVSRLSCYDGLQFRERFKIETTTRIIMHARSRKSPGEKVGTSCSQCRLFLFNSIYCNACSVHLEKTTDKNFGEKGTKLYNKTH